MLAFFNYTNRGKKMKITKPQIESIKELKKRGGQVLTSQWVNGHGNYITRRAIPPFSDRIERSEKSKYPKRIQKLFKQHPKCQAVIAITNMRTVNKLLSA